MQNQSHRPGELGSFLAIVHLLVSTYGRQYTLPYDMKIIIKFAPFNLYFTDQ